jgi:Na+/citrate or Na+/malate symporter
MIGQQLKTHGVILPQLIQIELNLLPICFYLLLVIVVTIRLYMDKVSTKTIGLLLLLLVILLTTYTFITPMLAHKIEHLVLMGQLCVAPRVLQIIQRLPCIQMDEVKQ